MDQIDLAASWLTWLHAALSGGRVVGRHPTPEGRLLLAPVATLLASSLLFFGYVRLAMRPICRFSAIQALGLTRLVATINRGNYTGHRLEPGGDCRRGPADRCRLVEDRLPARASCRSTGWPTSYLKIDELLACSSRARRGRSTTSCSSSSSTRSTSSGSRSCCTSSTGSGVARRRRTAPRAAHAEADPDDPESHGRAAGHPRDHDAARIPHVPRAARSGERLSVRPVPPDRVRARREVAAAIRRFPEGEPRAVALERRYREPTLWDAFLRYLSREGYAVPPSHLERDVVAPIEPSPDVQRILLAVYRDDPKNAELCERLVDLDEGIQEWRYRHVKMVERTIGAKSGTGGSSARRICGKPSGGRPTCFAIFEIRLAGRSLPPGQSRCRTTPAFVSPSGCC